MALKTFNPVTPASRTKELPKFDEITKKKPEKSLLRPLKRTGGRNIHGRITSRHIGGGHKRHYRVIDFKRDRREEDATVVGIEYDPNRSARIALLQYEDGEKRYILAPRGIQVNGKIRAGEKTPVRPGNAMPLKNIPLGTDIHNIEMQPGRGGKIARSAGQAAVLSNREGGYALIKMPSGEFRRIRETCYATIGQVGNTDHMNVIGGKAGRTRWQGRRPHVRGMCMNPVDHPNGGGEGRSKSGGGRQHPRSPWGQISHGQKTRAGKKAGDRFIVQRRKTKKKR
jgi:large subunit ribosomal protein L2